MGLLPLHGLASTGLYTRAARSRSIHGAPLCPIAVVPVPANEARRLDESHGNLENRTSASESYMHGFFKEEVTIVK